MELLKSKKMIVTMTAMVLVTLGTILIGEQTRLEWFVGIIGGMVGAFNVGQGIADGWSQGKTSSSTTTTECACKES